MIEKILMVCPKCGFDFCYDRNHINKIIFDSTEKLIEARRKIARINTLSSAEQYSQQNVKKALIREVGLREVELTRIKHKRREIWDIISNQEHRVLNAVIKEVYGEEALKKLYEIVHERTRVE